MKYCFGIDIGGTTVKMGLFQEDGELLDKWEIKTRTENQGEAILPESLSFHQEALPVHVSLLCIPIRDLLYSEQFHPRLLVLAERSVICV